jgi:hypothetical protein
MAPICRQKKTTFDKIQRKEENLPGGNIKTLYKIFGGFKNHKFSWNVSEVKCRNLKEKDFVAKQTPTFDVDALKCRKKLYLQAGSALPIFAIVSFSKFSYGFSVIYRFEANSLLSI